LLQNLTSGIPQVTSHHQDFLTYNKDYKCTTAITIVQIQHKPVPIRNSAEYSLSWHWQFLSYAINKTSFTEIQIRRGVL
jgi:hypothetical protein